MLSLQEKIAVRGVESLSDVELLALLLGEDNDESLALAERLLNHYNSSLITLAKEELARLRMSEGIGLNRAIRLKVAAEWGRRIAINSGDNECVINSTNDVVNIFRPYMESMQHEECWVLFLSSSNRVIERYRVSQGGLSATVVDKRLVIKRALELLSTQIVLVHNHPSGISTPSAEDIELTQKLKSAADLFDITLVDHVIIASSSSFSLRGNGLM